MNRHETVGDGTFGNLQTEQAVQHLGEAGVAYHLAAVQIRDKRDDARAERGAGWHVGGRLGGDGFPQQGQSPRCKLIRVVIGLIGGSSI